MDEPTTPSPMVELQANTEDFPKEMKFKSPPDMLELCIVDSMMPSPRFMQRMTHDQSLTPPPSSIQFEDEMLLQAGSTLSIAKPPPLLQTDNETSPSPCVANKAPEKLINSLQGAWKSPLKTSNPEIPILRYNTGSLLSDLDSQWPSLANGIQTGNRRSSQALPKSTHPTVEKESLASFDLDIGLESVEYPWAAKMKPSVRNLHRVTNPSFMEDGTPKVCIPKQVLLEGVENQKEFIIGQFYRCAAPSGGQIHAVMSKIWGTRCRIFTRRLGVSSFLFHIPDESTRQWILQRGLWHVDDCLMFVSSWNPTGTIALPEIKTIPVWLTLKNIPSQLYSTKGISWIGSGLGAPMLTSRPWLDPTQLGEAKILVEVKLDKPFPPKVAIEDESGSITMVDVLYSWLPPKCVKCGQLGHKATRCLGKPPSKLDDQPSIPIDRNTVGLAKTTTPLMSEDSTSVKNVSAPVQPSTQNIKSSGIKNVSSAPVGTSSKEVLLVSENMEITLPIAASPEAGPIMTETASHSVAITDSGDLSLPASPNVLSTLPIASHSDGITDLGDLSPPALPNALSTQSTLRDDTSTLEATTVVTDAEDGSSVCRSLDTEAFQGNEDYVDDDFMRTQRGRTVKPSQKLLEMEWSTVKGKPGQGGRKGRGRGGKYG